jgi:hypothetical protein
MRLIIQMGLSEIRIHDDTFDLKGRKKGGPASLNQEGPAMVNQGEVRE